MLFGTAGEKFIILLTTKYTYIHICSVLGKSHLGAKHDFEIWAFEVFFFGQEKHPLEWLLEAQT